MAVSGAAGLDDACLQGFGDARGDTIGLCPHRVGLQMGVALGGQRAGMPEQTLQQGQADPPVDANAGEAVP